MQEEILIQLGADGGSITLNKNSGNSITFQVIIEECNCVHYEFPTIDIAWGFITDNYKYWFGLYLIHISPEIARIVIRDYQIKELTENLQDLSWKEKLAYVS